MNSRDEINMQNQRAPAENPADREATEQELADEKMQRENDIAFLADSEFEQIFFESISQMEDDQIEFLHACLLKEDSETMGKLILENYLKFCEGVYDCQRGITR